MMTPTPSQSTIGSGSDLYDFKSGINPIKSDASEASSVNMKVGDDIADVVVVEDDPDFIWKALRCWVKCDLNGKPVEPFEHKGLAKWSDIPMGKGMKQGSLDSYIRPGLGSQRLPYGKEEVVKYEDSNNDPHPKYPYRLLHDLHNHMCEQKDKGKWLRELPITSVKVKSFVIPLKKGLHPYVEFIKDLEQGWGEVGKSRHRIDQRPLKRLGIGGYIETVWDESGAF